MSKIPLCVFFSTLSSAEQQMVIATHDIDIMLLILNFTRYEKDFSVACFLHNNW